MELRKYCPADLKAVVSLFYETVNHISRDDYSDEQIRAWSYSAKDLLLKGNFFLDMYTIVAVENKTIIGYGNIDLSGYLDHLYVKKDFQRKGIATAICNKLEQYAYHNHLKKVCVHSSVTALPFFQNRAYKIIKEQEVERLGIKLTNFIMEKKLQDLA